MNLHDIAREAGVSIATVSRVINNSPLVSEKTRRKVQEVIDRYGYTPNALARSLIQNATKTIGVLTVDIRHPYFAVVVHSVERELRHLGYNIFLCNTGGELEEKIRYIHALLEKKVDGLVFVGSVYKEKKGNQHIVNASQKVPVVLLNNHINAENIFCILCDDQRGTYEATKYLLEKGYKNIIYLHNSNTFSGLSKRKGFLKAMKEKGISQYRILTAGKDYLSLSKKLEIEYKRIPFDAIVASDDIHANQSIIALHHMNISIPDQVAVIGYNNSPICNYTYPLLSSVDSCMEDLGVRGARLLDQVLKGHLPEKKVQFLTPTLILRQSC